MAVSITPGPSPGVFGIPERKFFPKNFLPKEKVLIFERTKFVSQSSVSTERYPSQNRKRSQFVCWLCPIPLKLLLILMVSPKKSFIYEKDDAFYSFGRKCKDCFIGRRFSGPCHAPVLPVLVCLRRPFTLWDHYHEKLSIEVKKLHKDIFSALMI